MRRALLAAVLGALLAPSTVSADTICVSMPDPAAAGCVGPNHPSIQAAMDDASQPPNVRDTIRVGAGLFEAASVYQANAAANPVDVVGSGQGPDGTVLKSTTAQAAIRLTTASTITNVRVIVPGNRGDNPAGLDLDQGDASDVTVVAEPGAKGSLGILMRKTSSVRRATVDVTAGSGLTQAVSIGSAGTHLVEDSVLDGGSMVNMTSLADGATVRRVRSTKRCFSCLYAGAGNLDVSDSLVLVAAEGQAVYSQPGTKATVRNLTIDGVPGTNTAGLRANGSGRVEALDSIIRNVNYALYTDGTAHLAIDYSNFDPDKLQKVGVAGLLEIGSHNVNEDPRWVDPAAGNYRLASGSPVADRASPGNGATEFDLDRAPRLADANGDGSAVLDMGAYEYAGQPYALPPVQTHNGTGGGGGGGGGGGTGGGPAMQFPSTTSTLDLKRKMKLKLRCPASEPGPCRDGYVTIATVKRYRLKKGGKLQYVFIAKRKAFKPIASGQTATVTITVPKSAAALIRKLKKVKLSVFAFANGQANISNSSVAEITIKAAKPKRKK